MIAGVLDWVLTNLHLIALIGAVFALLWVASTIPLLSEVEVDPMMYFGKLIAAMIFAVLLPELIRVFVNLDTNWYDAVMMLSFAFGIWVQRPWLW